MCLLWPQPTLVTTMMAARAGPWSQEQSCQAPTTTAILVRMALALGCSKDKACWSSSQSNSDRHGAGQMGGKGCGWLETRRSGTPGTGAGKNGGSKWWEEIGDRKHSIKMQEAGVKLLNLPQCSSIPPYCFPHCQLPHLPPTTSSPPAPCHLSPYCPLIFCHVPVFWTALVGGMNLR